MGLYEVGREEMRVGRIAVQEFEFGDVERNFFFSFQVIRVKVDCEVVVVVVGTLHEE